MLHTISQSVIFFNCQFCPLDGQFTITENSNTHQIFTFKKLEPQACLVTPQNSTTNLTLNHQIQPLYKGHHHYQAECGNEWTIQKQIQNQCSSIIEVCGVAVAGTVKADFSCCGINCPTVAQTSKLHTFQRVTNILLLKLHPAFCACASMYKYIY